MSDPRLQGEPRPGVHLVPYRTVRNLVVGGFVVYQVVLLWIWTTFAALDWFLLRVSLSSADALAIASLWLGLYSYRNVENMGYNEEAYTFIARACASMQREGVDPERAGRTVKAVLARAERLNRMSDKEFDALLDGARRKNLRRRAAVRAVEAEPEQEAPVLDVHEVGDKIECLDCLSVSEGRAPGDPCEVCSGNRTVPVPEGG